MNGQWMWDNRIMDKRCMDNGCWIRICPAKETCKRSNGNFDLCALPVCE